MVRLREFTGGGTDPVALHEPLFAGEEWALVKECLDTGWVSYAGAFVDEFERRLAERCGTRHAVAVVNGTAALHMAAIVAGVEAGDEVLVPTLTFVATVNAVAHAGAVPHFVDSAADTLGIDPDALTDHLEAVAEMEDGKLINRRTRRRIAAIVPVHVFGHPVDMDGVSAVAARFGLPVIEDATEALGSLYRGKPCGSLGLLGTLSFNGNKIITTGGGGAILTDDADLARRAKHLATTAKLAHRWEFLHDEVGYNYRLPNLNAAVGCAQLDQLDGFLAAKRRLAERYLDAFDGFEGLSPVREPRLGESNYWLNAVRLQGSHVHLRDDVLAATNAAGLMCRPVWRPIHRLDMYEAAPRAPLPMAEAIEKELINVPSSAKLGR